MSAHPRRMAQTVTPGQAPVAETRPGINRPVVALVASAALAGTLASGGMVLHSSQAAFTASVSNGPQTYQAGTMTLAADSSTSLFTSINNLKPGDNSTSCIKITYTGTLSSAVKLHATVTNGASSAMATYLKFDIEQGLTGPANDRNCGTAPAFSPTASAPFPVSNVAAGSLPSTYAGGYACWTATNNTSRWYRIKYTLDATTPNSEQGKSVDVTFTWEAQ